MKSQPKCESMLVVDIEKCVLRVTECGVNAQRVQDGSGSRFFK